MTKDPNPNPCQSPYSATKNKQKNMDQEEVAGSRFPRGLLIESEDLKFFDDYCPVRHVVSWMILRPMTEKELS